MNCTKPAPQPLDERDAALIRVRNAYHWNLNEADCILEIARTIHARSCNFHAELCAAVEQYEKLRETSDTMPPLCEHILGMVDAGAFESPAEMLYLAADVLERDEEQEQP